ncbi:hypothetical protein QVD17_29006 [Tagetes erecta]|uniref:Uncharacterized protein n=1 Tax=Tagetes erecta TaxID=13708 RepID=A0AAD8KDR2_TARER|nr:hypothetical protein QVD17_29006 [Tagetes erecta]
MEHQKSTGKSTNKILNFLPRATSSFTFQNPPIYSPSKDNKQSEKTHKSNLGIGFSGPLVSIVPSDTRRKIKNDSKMTLLQQPTNQLTESVSPRVSCMGQVKCKHYRKLTGAGAGNVTNKWTNKFSRTTSCAPVRSYHKEEDQETVVKVIKTDSVVVKNKKKLGFRSLFGGGGGGSRRKSDVTATALTFEKGPCLTTMKRFSSGREAFMSFDWTTQVTPLVTGNSPDGEEVVVPSSAPVVVRIEGVCGDFVRVGGVKLEPR